MAVSRNDTRTTRKIFREIGIGNVHKQALSIYSYSIIIDDRYLTKFNHFEQG